MDERVGEDRGEERKAEEVVRHSEAGVAEEDERGYENGGQMEEEDELTRGQPGAAAVADDQRRPEQDEGKRDRVEDVRDPHRPPEVLLASLGDLGGAVGATLLAAEKAPAHA